MVTECNHESFAFSDFRKGGDRAEFSGASISSNGGVLLLREANPKLGLTSKVAPALGERRQLAKCRHPVLSMVRQRVHALTPAYDVGVRGSPWAVGPRAVSATSRRPIPSRPRQGFALR